MDNNFEIVDNGNNNVPSTENQNSDTQNQSSILPRRKRETRKRKLRL